MEKQLGCEKMCTINEFNKIMVKRSGIDFHQNTQLWNTPLLGNELNIPVRELILIYFDIESVFKFKVPEDEIIEGCFKTYDSILKMIKKYVTLEY